MIIIFLHLTTFRNVLKILNFLSLLTTSFDFSVNKRENNIEKIPVINILIYVKFLIVENLIKLFIVQVLITTDY